MKLVITHHQPLRKALYVFLGILIVALAVAVALDYGHWQSIARSMVSTDTKRELLKEVSALRKDNERLNFELSRLHRSRSINEQTLKENHQHMVELREQIATLSSEVDFFRDVVGATEIGNGPRVNGLRVSPLNDSNRFAYMMIMTNVTKDDSTAEGRLSVQVVGDLNGKKKSLDYQDIVETGPASLAFKFKHFHLFEGTLKMPADFVPSRIGVTIKRKARQRDAAVISYDWAAVLN